MISAAPRRAAASVQRPSSYLSANWPKWLVLSGACRQLQTNSSCKCRKSRPSTSRCSPACPCVKKVHTPFAPTTFVWWLRLSGPRRRCWRLSVCGRRPAPLVLRRGVFWLGLLSSGECHAPCMVFACRPSGIAAEWIPTAGASYKLRVNKVRQSLRAVAEPKSGRV
jgi:hypothetical protein